MKVAERQRDRVEPETQQAIVAAVRLGLAGLRQDAPERLSDWAIENFSLVAESSHQKGGWVPWPFQIGWMDAFSNDDIEHVDVQKSKRTGYTKTVAAFVAYNIAHRRRKQAVWQPTDDDRDSFVKSEIDPLLDPKTGLKAIRAARKAANGRLADTIGYKQFRDSVAHFLGGKAARAYRRITVAVAIVDEWSGFDQIVEKSSDPGTLAKGRLEGAPYPKFVGGSTPRVRGTCHVETSRLLALADLRYCIRCPHCAEEHSLHPGDAHPSTLAGKKFGHGLKWTPGKPETVRHVCPHCGAEIRQADYLRVWRDAAWVCVKTGIRYGADRIWRDADGAVIRPPKHVAFKVWAAYSPQRDWSDIADEFEKKRASYRLGLHAPMQGFVNETLAETWEVVGDSIDEHELQKRAEPYALGEVQPGAVVLTAGVDLQGSRWEIAVWAWARGLESWAVDHYVIEGNPQDDDDWNEVETHLRRQYPLAGAAGSLGIEAISLDSNYQTQAALNFVRRMQGSMRIFAVRGEGHPKKPIRGPGNSQDVTWRGQKYPKGVKLWQTGVKQGKDLLHGQLAIDLPEGAARAPGYVHVSRELQREWFEQLTAEQRVMVSTPTGQIERWVKRRKRNEVLDGRVYAAHAAHMLRLDRWAESRWQRLEERIWPTRSDVAVPATAAPAPAPTTPPPPPATQPEAQPDPPQAAPAAPPPAEPPPRPAVRKGRRVRGRFGGWTP